MSFLNDVYVWFNDPLNWQGPNGVLARVGEHVALSLGALLIACLVAVPSAALLGRSQWSGTIALNLANIGRAIPSFAVLVLGVIWLGFGSGPTYIALTLLAIPPIFTLTFTAIRQVDPAMVDAAKGMGMTGGAVLWRVQLPVARPLILNGIRLASAAVIATATLASLIGGGGLGRFIKDGFAVRNFAEVAAGTLLVMALVLLSEAFFALLFHFTVSPGLRTGRRRRRRPVAMSVGA